MILTVGTSIEAGSGHAPGESWPQRLALRAPQLTFVDRSLGGGAYTHDNDTGENLEKRATAAVAELAPNVLILGGPVNDLVSLYEVSPLRWAMWRTVLAAHNAGVGRVLVMGILPFTDGAAFPAGWWASLEQRRQDYNAWAATMYGSDYIDLSWALKETATARGDARWFRDGLHLSRVGAALVAEVFPLNLLEV